MASKMISIIGSLDPRLKEVVIFIKNQAEKHGVHLYLTKYGELKHGNSICNGYFCSVSKQMAFWIDNENLNWLPVAIHEYSHMLQWINKRKFWNNVDKYYGRIEPFMNGKKFSNKKIDAAIHAAIACEFDNEKQTVSIMKKLGIDDLINTDDYTRKANSYVLFHHMIRKYASFYPQGKEPYRVKEVWSKMPKHFDYNPYNPPEKYIKILDEYYGPLLTKDK